ncbi:N-6 DNA methylase, partial [bacterium]|nr:N-6 DNA methylase [bacterium]
MNKFIDNYLQNINTRFRAGISTEHSYRGDLQTLVESINPGVLATNEPARVACGAPDYIITKRNIPVGYIEAKDIGKPLDSREYKEQFDRYKKSLPNLIITDYLDFRLYIDGKFITSIKIAEIEKGKIHPKPENFDTFTDLIINFCTYVGQTIKSASKLSKMMAGKARLLETVIEQALLSDEDNEADSTLKEQMKAFKDVLIHDITPSEFADIYAQTIAYGMFAARLHDKTLEDFSRQEAAELIPKTNPFLRKLFQYIAGYDLDDRIKWIVDALAEIFRATNVAELLKDFGSATQQNDPMVHFYEKFLAEYNPKLRKSRGVWYTPEPVVNFIVRAVDDILKTEFGLSQGLANTSKTTIEIDTQTLDKRSPTAYKRIKQEVHKVQILDPAAGTGTFLAEIVKHIYKKFEGQQGIWSQYVENHLIPRLNGFELLMASYAMAHLKLDLLLRETGYKPKKEQRFRVFLTNSLEEHHPDTGTLFANWLSTEANEANHIKRDTPVMCVIGNPPYSGESANKGDWIMNLMQDYKKEPGGEEKLK